MRQMKLSSEPWVGEIPSEWNENKIKYVAPIHNERSESNDGYIGLENIEGWTGKLIPSESVATGESVAFKENDVLFGKLRPYLAKSLLVKKDGCGSTELLVMRPEKILPGYLAYITRTVSFVDRIDISTYGAKMPRANAGFIGNLLVPIPDTREQQAIVDYLDSKCAAIDEAIERHKKAVEKLTAFRKEHISHIVTHGIRNAAMNKTGIVWIQEIPEHWDVCRTKYVFQQGDEGIKVGPFGSALRGNMLSSGPYKVYNQAHLINNDFALSRHFISAETFRDLICYEVKPGDILFSVMGTIGKCKQMPKGLQQGIMDSHLIKARLNNKMIPAYFEYVYDKDNSNIVIKQLLCMSQGSIMNGLNSSTIKNLYIPVPPIEEQQEIANYLYSVCEKIDRSISVQLDLIEKIKEYRKSLIYHAVTGKIDCRGADAS